MADHLVQSNLAGHDSHGVIRTKAYVEWLRDGKMHAGRTLEVVLDSGALAVVDGQMGPASGLAGRRWNWPSGNAAECARFIDFVKSCPPVDENGEVLTPGELEDRNRAQRSREGIELDDTTWAQI